ncbi:MAG: RusA family crossover junction endodeoxyribonuclease [Deltaproteobacteria bacterium]|nr:RusA family crossover junction endodeoxyribonuclease [Deltaproteobacteria bacterium]
MTVKLVLPITPKAQARPRFTRQGHAYKAKAQRQAEESLCALLAQHRPEKPLEGAITMTATAYLPIPRSWSRKKQAAAREGAIQPTGKPDLDNLVKHLKDCLTATKFWKDDALITEYTGISKRYDDGDGPRWEVSITAMEQTGK